MTQSRICLVTMLLAACLLVGCVGHTPGGGPLRTHCFDHMKRKRHWMMNHYFEPHRYDYNATCWSPMFYNPCPLCGPPGPPGGLLYESPSAEGLEAVQGVPESGGPPLDNPSTEALPNPRPLEGEDPQPTDLEPPAPEAELPELDLPGLDDAELDEPGLNSDGEPGLDDGSDVDFKPLIRPAFYGEAMPEAPEGAPVMRRLPR